MPDYPIGGIVATGQICPETGLWKVVGATPQVIRRIVKGETMPPHNGKNAGWQFLQHSF